MRERVWNFIRIAVWLLVFTAGLAIAAVLIAAACVPYILYEIAYCVYAFVAGKPYVPDGNDGWHFRM